MQAGQTQPWQRRDSKPRLSVCSNGEPAPCATMLIVLNSHVISHRQSASPHSTQLENRQNKRQKDRNGVIYTQALPEISTERLKRVNSSGLGDFLI